MHVKVKTVISLGGLSLMVRFENGHVRQYDVSQLLNRFPDFQALVDNPALFHLVKVDPGGYGVSWNDDIDLSCDELWYNGQEATGLFDGLLSLKEATSFWGLNESTLRKAISYGKLIEGIDVKKFGKQWVVSEIAMRREYGEPKARF